MGGAGDGEEGGGAGRVGEGRRDSGPRGGSRLAMKRVADGREFWGGGGDNSADEMFVLANITEACFSWNRLQLWWWWCVVYKY